jgi:poly(A) polymerase
MTAPRILTRPEHGVSRKNINPDALKVLYRLKNSGHLVYLVGGGVRDLLLGRRPKDFDIGTDAHPHEVKKLFRNCYVIGKRFRLCHVRFGQHVVEVSTFRRKSEAAEGDTLIRHDNTFGTPEEDAFRRDFTVNALFYDIASFSVIDYVDGLKDLRDHVIRTIGDPDVRFREDPVRMLRAVALGTRLGFRIEDATLEAIHALRGEIVKSSPARILEEIYKILRQGAATATMMRLHETGLLAYLMPEADAMLRGDATELLASLARLDIYRNAARVAPEDLSNPLIMGALLVPLGLTARRRSRQNPGDGATGEPAEGEGGDEETARCEAPEEEEVSADSDVIVPLSLPFARRDLDRLRLMLAAQRRLHDLRHPQHTRRVLARRHYFPDALRWAEMQGGEEGRALAETWRHLSREPERPTTAPESAADAGSGRRRPRRRRGRRRRGPRPSPPAEG